MDRLTFFKHGLSSALDAVNAVVGLKKAVGSFTEAVDDALSNIKNDMGLYARSLDADMYENPRYTLKEAARMGYTMIETDSYFNGRIYDLKPEDFRKAADEAGVKIAGAHLHKFYENDMSHPEGRAEAGPPDAPGGEVRNGDAAGAVPASHPARDISAEATPAEAEEDSVMKWWDEALALHRTLGCTYITVSRMPDVLTTDTAGDYAAYFDRVGEKARQHGMHLCLHPDSRVLRAEEGTSIFDILAEKCSPENVSFEIDTREADQAGADVCAMLKRYRKRIMLLHLQDYGVVTESGRIDFDKIVTAGINSGVKDIFVEVRSYTLPPKNCVERSIYNLESLPSLRY